MLLISNSKTAGSIAIVQDNPECFLPNYVDSRVGSTKKVPTEKWVPNIRSAMPHGGVSVGSCPNGRVEQVVRSRASKISAPDLLIAIYQSSNDSPNCSFIVSPVKALRWRDFIDPTGPGKRKMKEAFRAQYTQTVLYPRTGSSSSPHTSCIATLRREATEPRANSDLHLLYDRMPPK